MNIKKKNINGVGFKGQVRGIGMINATKQTCQLLTRILTFVSHFELPNGCQFLKHSDNLGQIWSLCRHFLAWVHDREGEDEVAFFSAKRWDRRNRADLIESATPCHDAQVVGSYRVSNPLRLTVLAAKSEDCTTVPQHLQLENRK